jgi:two-component system response regulator FixJ
MPTGGRVYVVDDDDLVRASLTAQLQPEHDVMCFAAARHFLDAAAALPPGCLLLDVHLPEMSGLEVQHWLAEHKLRFPVVMITGRADVGLAVRAMKAGAVDFLEKPFTRDAVLAAIRVAAARLAPAPSGANDARLAAARLARLTGRERQVLDGLVAGLPNKTIAYDLRISPRTVEMHRARVMAKLEARSLSMLVRLALAAGGPETAEPQWSYSHG